MTMKRTLLRATAAVDASLWMKTARAKAQSAHDLRVTTAAPASQQRNWLLTGTATRSFSSDPDTTTTTTPSERGYQSATQDSFHTLMQQDADGHRAQAHELLQTPVGAMTPELWLEVNPLLHWWSIQRTTESVDLSFQLLERMLKERHSQKLVNTSGTDPADDTGNSYSEWLNTDVLNRIINNWRVVWWDQQLRKGPDVLQETQQQGLFTPRMVWKMLEKYLNEYGFAMNEKSFYLILEAELTHPGGEDVDGKKHKNMRYATPEMANEIIERCIHLFETNGLQDCLPSTDLFNLAMRVWNESGRTKEAPDQCEALFKRMNQYNVTVNTRTYGGILHAWARFGSKMAVQKAHEWLYRMHASYLEGDATLKPDHAAIATVIAAWSRSGAPDAAAQSLELYRHLGSLVESNKIHVFNSLLTCFTKTRRESDVRQAERLFYELLHHDENTEKNDDKPMPNATTYLIVISAFAKVGRPDKAEALLYKMQKGYARGQGGLKPTNLHYTSVISAFAQSRRSDKIERIKALMKQMEDMSQQESDETLMPNLTTYNAFLSCYAHGKHPFAGSEAEQVLLDLKARADAGDLRYVPDRITYTTVINVYAKYGLVKEAIRVLENMYRDYCNGNESAQPDLHTYNTVLGAFSKGKDTKKAGEQASQFFERMKILAANGTIERPDLVSFSALIQAFATSKDEDKLVNAQRAEDVLRELQAAYSAGDEMLRPNQIVYNACINAWAAAGSFDRASDLLREMYLDYQMGNENACPDVISFNTLIKAFANAKRSDSGEKAEAIVEKMKELYASGALNVQPDSVTYTSLILSHVNSNRPGSLERAEEILRLMDQLHAAGELEQGATKQAFDTIRRKWASSQLPQKFERSNTLRKEIKSRFPSKPNSVGKKASSAVQGSR